MRANQAGFVAMVLLSSACRNLASGDPFAPDAVLHYSVQLEPDDWEVLRYEGRSLGILAGECNTFTDYTRFRSVTRAAGVLFRNVETRKKGTLGSLSSDRPSLKLDVGQDELDRGRTFRGSRWFTLNNNFQDPSSVRQCLAASVFEAAGVPSPRCNLAEVSIQSAPKGIYTHIEDIKRPFLERHFGDASGHLYEADKSDFSEAIKHRFELKNVELEPDRSDLDAVIAALNAPVGQLWEGLDEVIDIDQFVTFAAVEALVGHADGYTGSANNTYLYADPSDGRFRFIPWGMDQTFRPDRLDVQYPRSVHLGNELMDALWNDPAFREYYDDRVRELLDTVWNEAWLESEAYRWAEVAATDPAYLEPVLAFINEQRAAIELELGNHREWPRSPLRRVPTAEGEDCKQLEGFEAQFAATADGGGDLDASFSIDFRYDGFPHVVEALPGTEATGIQAGLDTSGQEQPRDVMVLRFWHSEEGNVTWATFFMPPHTLTEGTHPLHGFESFGVFGSDVAGAMGFVGNGEIEVWKAPTADDLELAGRIRGKVIPL